MDLKADDWHFKELLKEFCNTPKTYSYIMTCLKVGDVEDDNRNPNRYLEDIVNSRRVLDNGQIEFVAANRLFVIKPLDPKIYIREYIDGVPVDSIAGVSGDTRSPVILKPVTIYYYVNATNRYKKVYTHQLKYFLTHPEDISKFLSIDKLEVNHMFICHDTDKNNGSYKRAYELPQNLELVTKTQNKYHERFVNRCGLHKVRIPCDYIPDIECAFHIKMSNKYPFPIPYTQTVSKAKKLLSFRERLESVQDVYNYHDDKIKITLIGGNDL